MKLAGRGINSGLGSFHAPAMQAYFRQIARGSGIHEPCSGFQPSMLAGR
jgi:hypothetical protein